MTFNSFQHWWVVLSVSLGGILGVVLGRADVSMTTFFLIVVPIAGLFNAIPFFIRAVAPQWFA